MWLRCQAVPIPDATEATVNGPHRERSAVSRVLQFLGLVLYGVWVMRRVARAKRRRPMSGSHMGFGVRRGRRPVVDYSWTELDERQLIRLLTDSAP